MFRQKNELSSLFRKLVQRITFYYHTSEVNVPNNKEENGLKATYYF